MAGVLSEHDAFWQHAIIVKPLTAVARLRVVALVVEPILNDVMIGSFIYLLLSCGSHKDRYVGGGARWRRRRTETEEMVRAAAEERQTAKTRSTQTVAGGGNNFLSIEHSPPPGWFDSDR